MKRIRQAAKLRKWSFNTFVVDAANKEAEKTLTALENSEQLMASKDLLPLNQ
jgi:uncharacterized protein (DUF1778 family)